MNPLRKKAMKLDCLFISAHRDDTEITCGGLAIKLVDQGCKVGLLDLTRGEMGTRGTAATREREAKAAAKIMGIAVRDNVGLHDSGVEFTRANALKIARYIRKYRPHAVVIPYWEQRHPDHRNCSLLVWDACFYSGLKKMDLPGEAWRPFKIIYAASFQETKPSFIVDITDQLERKLKAVEAYKTQFFDEQGRKMWLRGFDIFEYMRVRARQYGVMIGKQYGEAYLLKETIEVGDIMKLSVKSI